VKEAIKHHRVTKTYQAIARGLVPWESTLVDAPIGRRAEQHRARAPRRRAHGLVRRRR
jgi:23S rRNA-/tRNA-specific pseudouridylate synthase